MESPADALYLLVMKRDDVVVINLTTDRDPLALPNGASRTEVLAALDALLRADRSMSAAQSEAPLRRLSPREMQVLKRIAEGARNREIAGELALSVKTIEKHRSSVMRKLNLRNTAALTAFAIENRLAGRTLAATA